MAQAEVLPIVLEGSDNTRSAWQSFIANAKGGQSAIEKLKEAVSDLSGGSAGGLSQLSGAARMLANPYVAAAATIAAVSAVTIKAVSDLAALGDAADEVGTKSGNVAGLASSLKKVGGEATDAVAALKTLRSQLDTTSRDGGYLENLFKLNGSSINDTAGQLKPLEDIYKQVAGYIQNARNETERLEIATSAFGQQAAPAMVKAILAGATGLEKIAKTDLDPVIKQSQELQRIWTSITGMQGGGLWDYLKNRAAENLGALAIGAAALAGNKTAQQSLYLMNNPDASRTLSQTDADSFYNAVGYGATKTPSNRPDDKGTAAFERAAVSIRKHTAEVQANAAAVDLGAGAIERMQTEAKLLAVAQEAGVPITDQLRERIARLAQDAGAAADALARAKVASDIRFDRGTAFLTQDDVQIANALKGVYGTDIPAALNSAYAAEMRFNSGLWQISATGQDVNRAVFTEFTQNLRNGMSIADAFGNALLNALGRISDKLAEMAADKLWQEAFGGSGGSGVLSLFGLGGLNSGAWGAANPGVAGSAFYGPVAPAFASGTSYAPGGLARVNEEGGEIIDLPTGSRVIPHDVSMAMAADGGGDSHFTFAPQYNVTGNSDDINELRAQIARDQADFERRVAIAVQKGRQARTI